MTVAASAPARQRDEARMPRPACVWLRRYAAGSALVAILLVAAYVRLSHPELSWFSSDQARDADAALAIISGRSFPLLGVAVAGGPAHTWGPAYFYLLAIPLAISRDPALAVAALGATSVAAVFVTYRIGLVFFSRAVGLLSAGLLATYPTSVLESKALWNVAPLTLFTAVFFHAVLSLVVHERSVMIIPALGTLGVMVQLHLSSLSLIVVLVVGVALFRPRMRGVHLVIGFGVLLALMSPYLVSQCLSGFADLGAGGSEGARLRFRGPAELGELALRILFASPDLVAGISALRDTWLPGAVLFLHRLEAWAFLLGLVFVALVVIWRSVRGAPRDGSYRATVVVALGFTIPFVILGSRAAANPYYFNVVFPMPAIAAALLLLLGINGFGEIAGVRARRALWAALAVVVTSTIMTQVDFHRQLWRSIQVTGGTGLSPDGLELMPIRYKAELARILVNDFSADSQDVFLRVHGSRARDLLEDRGYFFEATAAARPPGAATRSSRSRHYAVVLDEAGGAALHGGQLARAGPYTVVEYTPWIEYSTWRCTDDPPADSHLRGRGGAPEWTPVRLPTARLPRDTTYGVIPHRSWPSPIVSCRGTVSGGPPRTERLRIVVSLRGIGGGNPRVEPIHVNGASIAATRVLAHSTFAAHTIDAIFDATGHLRDGPNDVRVQISGGTSRFDLDVYELHG